jgi:peptidoglycan/xylan/chitin deacetylase (PgdA/CDA1 family)
VATILNLHRVGNNAGSAYRPLDPTLFDELLTFAKHEFAVVTIAELREKSRKPKLVLSFDDGYRDFATTAVPILRKHGLRANQNIIPRCVETGLPPLNVMAKDVSVRRRRRWSGSSASRAFPGRSTADMGNACRIS